MRLSDSGKALVHMLTAVTLALALAFEPAEPDVMLMIGSTDGRSYRGQKANGCGVHDLRVPKAEPASKLAGCDTPPGLGVE